MILVDTPIWSLALRRRPHDLNPGEERHVREWERLRAALRPFPDLPITTDHYEWAAQAFNRCRAKGIAGSAIDLIICAVSGAYGAPIYTTDVDFRRYTTVLKLKLHVPRTRPQDSE